VARAIGSQRTYGLLCAAFFAFFLAWSFSFSMFPIWLNQTVGLGGRATGVVFSANALAGLVVMPCYGLVQDRVGLRKHLLYLVAAGLLLTGPVLIWVYEPLLSWNLIVGAILGGLFFGVTFGAGVGALETYVERSSRAAGFEFGKARMWGSLGWAAAASMAGHLFNVAPGANFWLASASGLAFLGLVALVRSPAATPAGPAREKVGSRDIVSLLGSRRFWAFATFVMGVSCVYSVYDQQFPVYFASLFPTRAGGNTMYGYLNSLQVFLEAGGMFVAPLLVNRIGAKQGLVLSGVVMAVRILGSGLSDGAIEISAMKLLHAVELPLMVVSLFKYISATFDPRLSATLYIVGFQFMSQVAASGLSVVAGAMYDRYGFATSYLMLGAVVAVFVVISQIVLTSDRRIANVQAPPEGPFPMDGRPIPSGDRR